MIRSMTGFGRQQAVSGGWDVTVEIKTVNHRYFEYSARLPRAYGFLDDRLKTLAQGMLSRGKAELYVYMEPLERAEVEVAVNHPLAAAYLTALGELAARHGLPLETGARTLAQFSDVLTLRRAAEDEDAVWAACAPVAEAAIARCLAMRESEGERLREDVLSRRLSILEAVGLIEARVPEMVREHMDKVRARMAELLETAAVDEQRLLTEAAIFADRTAVAEETVRLRSHLEQLAELMDGAEPVGRKLDFLLQEMNREINTVGSKVQDVQLARVVVDVKAELEKIREQVQNIE